MNKHIDALNDSQHDVWDVVSQFSVANTSQNLRSVSKGNKQWIDNNFEAFLSLMNELNNTDLNDGGLTTNVVQYTRILFAIHDLIEQHPILKYIISTKPELFTKLLFPQIKYGLVITTNLKLKKNISQSTDFIEHFYYLLSITEYPKRGPSFRTFGSLFGLKLLDSAFKHQLHAVKSADILKLVPVPRNLLRCLLFDGGVFDILCNPLFYPSLRSFGYDMSKAIKRYFKFKGIPQWLDAEVVYDIQMYRRSVKFSFRHIIVTHIEYLWLTQRKLFLNYPENLQHLAELLIWIREELEFAYNEIMGPLCMRILRIANMSEPTDLDRNTAFSDPVTL